DRDRTISVLVAPNPTAYADATYTDVDLTRRASDFLRLKERLRSLPGVAAVTEGAAPFRPADRERRQRDPMEVRAGGTVHKIHLGIVRGGPHYCSTVGIPLVAGRDLDNADFRAGAIAVAVVGERTARMLWPDGDAVGRRLSWGQLSAALPSGRLVDGGGGDVLVVGVARDAVRSGVRGTTLPALYLPDVSPSDSARLFFGLVVRTVPRGRGMVGSVTAAVREVFANPLTLRVTTVEQIVENEMMSERLGAALFRWFAAVALALGLIGMWSLVTYLVARTTHELGVRLVLGASPGQLMRQWTLRGMLPVGAGIILGLAGAALTTRLLSAFLFEIGSLDAAIAVACAALFLAGSVLASYIPTRRVLKVETATVLRAE
ncbi:MAG: ABC transporter permease, partial [Vicinamibacterales bacterium]|nr:ABC transporter permease [Vicinamibacterales bacterium]